jgi:hypothetical protein
MAFPTDSDPAPIPEPESRTDPSYSGPAWSLAHRLAFRFALVYLILYMLPFPIDALDSLIASVGALVTGEESDPDHPSFLSRNVTKPYEEFWDGLVLRAGKEVFGVEIEYRPLGSGDTTWNYVSIFEFAVISATVLSNSAIDMSSPR